MKKEIKRILILIIFIGLMSWILYNGSEDDIQPQEKTPIQTEMEMLDGIISGLNQELSGYQSGYMEQEDIIIKAKNIQKGYVESGNILRERIKIYEFKKGLLQEYSSTGSISTGIKKIEEELKLPPMNTAKTSMVPKVDAAYVPTTGLIGIKGFPKDSIATLVMTKAKNLRGIEWALTLYGENGSFGIDRQSECVSEGVRERSFGFCQLMEKYHAPFIWNTGYKLVGKIYVVDPIVAKQGGHTDKFMNWEKQLDYCTAVRDDAKRKGTMPFYANGHWKNYLPKVIYY